MHMFAYGGVRLQVGSASDYSARVVVYTADAGMVGLGFPSLVPASAGTYMEGNEVD